MWIKNTTGVSDGSFRSLNGAADESIFQGKASKAGYYCFFKVWRDMPYDAVVDHEGILFRIEVKGSSGNSFSVTRGGRSGEQINRAVASRTRIIERGDCDFVVGVDSNNGDCYIIPTDIIEVIGVENISRRTVSDYLEKWDLFKFGGGRMSDEQTRDGICGLSLAEVSSIASGYGIVAPNGALPVPGTRKTISDDKKKLIYLIWKHLATM